MAGGGGGAAGASRSLGRRGTATWCGGGPRLDAGLGGGEEPLLLVGVEDHGAAEIRHVAAGQVGALELGFTHPVEEELVLADEDRVAVAQRPLGDLVAVHEGAVGALEVLDDELRALARDPDVVRRDRRVVDHDRVVGQAADGHRGRVRHGRLLQHPTLEQKHQLRHVVEPVPLSAKSASEAPTVQSGRPPLHAHCTTPAPRPAGRRRRRRRAEAEAGRLARRADVFLGVLEGGRGRRDALIGGPRQHRIVQPAVVEPGRRRPGVVVRVRVVLAEVAIRLRREVEALDALVGLAEAPQRVLALAAAAARGRPACDR